MLRNAVDEKYPPVESASLDGPGHEAFPAVDTGYVAVSNVRRFAGQATHLPWTCAIRTVRKIAVGTVSAVLLTADGKRRTLDANPDSAASFRINRFKRAVMMVDAGRSRD